MVKLVLSVQMEKKAKLDHQVLLDILEVQETRETRGLRGVTAFQAQKENEARMGCGEREDRLDQEVSGDERFQGTSGKARQHWNHRT